jgi:ABC-2 type transport system permease protein
MSFKRLFAIIKKEIIHIKRDKPSLMMGFVAPVIMILLFGYAVNTDMDNIKTAVLDMDKTQMSRDAVEAFKNSNYFDVVTYVPDIKELKEEIDSNKVKAGIVIESGFNEELNRNEKPELLFIVDGSDPSIARTAYSSGMFTAQAFSAEMKIAKLMKSGGRITPEVIDIKSQVLYNPQMKSANFTIPGLIGLIMQNITVMLIAFALVREKERGTIEQLIVTPVKPFELIFGKLIPYTFIGFIDLLIATFFGTWWFKVPIKGSLILLIILGLGFVFCALAMGILISTVAQNQLQAMQMSILIILPSVLLSGFMFPREAMPQFIRLLGGIFPITYFLVILRGIISKGAALSLMMNEVLILFGVGAGLFVLSIIRFRKKLD